MTKLQNRIIDICKQYTQEVENNLNNITFKKINNQDFTVYLWEIERLITSIDQFISLLDDDNITTSFVYTFQNKINANKSNSFKIAIDEIAKNKINMHSCDIWILRQ